MKKFIIILSLILAAALLAGGLFVINILNSPQYALLQTMKDVQDQGVDGLNGHLTENAQKTVDSITAVTDNAIVSGIIDLVTPDNAAQTLAANLAEVDWSLEDVLRGKNQADVEIGFNYRDQIVGTIQISMVREDHSWKIDSIELPDFDSLQLFN